MKIIWRTLVTLVVITLYEIADYIETLSDRIADKNGLVIEGNIDELFGDVPDYEK